MFDSYDGSLLLFSVVAEKTYMSNEGKRPPGEAYGFVNENMYFCFVGHRGYELGSSVLPAGSGQQ